ncbi:unnamed protein product [marine sediment metagenome]|uniref:Uncharacterized protein n=1 Tax=marine sediment metagenome TaxID=412755 RepID=X0SIL4_9ZZZZ
MRVAAFITQRGGGLPEPEGAGESVAIGILSNCGVNEPYGKAYRRRAPLLSPGSIRRAARAPGAVMSWIGISWPRGPAGRAAAGCARVRPPARPLGR